MQRGVAIGLSLDCAVDEIVTRTRKTWDGHSIYAKVVATMEKLRGYSNYSVICTVTRPPPPPPPRWTNWSRRWNSSMSAASPAATC